jgi:hypothetical protein
MTIVIALLNTISGTPPLSDFYTFPAGLVVGAGTVSGAIVTYTIDKAASPVGTYSFTAKATYASSGIALTDNNAQAPSATLNCPFTDFGIQESSDGSTNWADVDGTTWYPTSKSFRVKLKRLGTVGIHSTVDGASLVTVSPSGSGGAVSCAADADPQYTWCYIALGSGYVPGTFTVSRTASTVVTGTAALLTFPVGYSLTSCITGTATSGFYDLKSGGPFAVVVVSNGATINGLAFSDFFSVSPPTGLVVAKSCASATSCAFTVTKADTEVATYTLTGSAITSTLVGSTFATDTAMQASGEATAQTLAFGYLESTTELALQDSDGAPVANSDWVMPGTYRIVFTRQGGDTVGVRSGASFGTFFDVKNGTTVYNGFDTT